MNQKRIGSAILGVLVLAAGGVLGKWYMDECDDIGTCSTSKWNNPNFEIITVASYNYTDYDIYGVYLLPLDKSSLDHAAHGSGNRATRRDEAQWEGLGSGPGLAWDYRWPTPRQFKVWWLRVTDQSIYSNPNNKHDAYTMQHSMPGTAWCEGEITVTRPPIRTRTSDLVLHFYPDGRVEGDVEYGSGPASRVDISRRDDLPKLAGRSCLKEIPNPFFGRKRPISTH
jgi:hypothetical protein